MDFLINDDMYKYRFCYSVISFLSSSIILTGMESVAQSACVIVCNYKHHIFEYLLRCSDFDT